jgi:membrane associated rhomboid family serine protease
MTPWVRRLIVANIVIFGLQFFVPSVTYWLVLVPSQLPVRPWTIITYMFLHDTHNIFHILFNMYSLYLFGPRVEERLTSANFIWLYMLAGVGGGLLSWVMTPNIPILGASGAIMGLIVAYAMYWPHDQLLFWGIVPVQMWVLCVGYVLLDLVGFGANIAHFAHLGGAATGFLFLKLRDARAPARAWKKKVASQPRSPVIGGIGNGDPLKRWRDIRLDDLHPINRDEVVRLLRKAQQHGTRSLTNEERATLDRFAGTPS